MFVFIKHRALSVNNEYMPLFLYATPLNIVSETDDTITVRWKDSEYYTYVYDKKNIDRRFD